MIDIRTASRSPAYRFARANGCGITDAIKQARSSAAYRKAAVATCQAAARSLRNRKAGQ